MNLTPLRNNIIIERLEKDLKTASGIILKTNDEADKAKVTAIGPEVKDVNVDDLVLINWNKAKKIDNDVYQLSIDDVIAVYE
jgi:co-chaperonin GroES (HSP10)